MTMTCTSRARKFRSKDVRHAFTLMEVLLVLVILVILASLAVSTYRGVRGRALTDAAKTKVHLITDAIELYENYIPTPPANLNDLINKPSDARLAEKWAGPYLKDAGALRDPWDNDIRYVAPGKHNPDTYDVWSVGPDGQDGTADDIGNWDKT